MKNLKERCENNDEEECMKLCQKNPFLKSIKDFNYMNKEIKNKALNYLKGLKAGAFFRVGFLFLIWEWNIIIDINLRKNAKIYMAMIMKRLKKLLKKQLKKKQEKWKKKILNI